MDLKTTLQHINNATGILIQLYQGNDVVYFGEHPFEPNPASQIIPNAVASGCSLGFSVSPDNIFSGFVRIHNSSNYLIVGPMLISECTRKQAQSIIFHMQLPENKVDALLEWLRSIPITNNHRFFGILNLLDLTVNGKTDHEIVAIPYPNELFQNQPISKESEFIESISPNLEQAILSNIQYGNVDELEKLIRFFAPMNMSSFDAKTKKLYYDIFLASSVLSSRFAVMGGLDYSIASAMANKYMEIMNTLNNATDIILLLKKMFIDFAKKVALSNELPADSMLVKQIRREIQAHLYEKITPTLIAANLSMNCSYLCNHFKKETGKTITEYINELKIHESKRLLKNSKLPLIEISTYLGFSSQSYFHIVFKKQTGMTPLDFRNNNT